MWKWREVNIIPFSFTHTLTPVTTGTQLTGTGAYLFSKFLIDIDLKDKFNRSLRKMMEILNISF